MTSVRVDVAVITSAMMSASDPVARGARERVVQSSSKLLLAREGTWSI